MLGRLKDWAKPLLRWIGYEVHAYTPQRNHELRKLQLMRDSQINLVIDAGANVGQYGERIRNLGYAGRIVSIEPLPKAFTILRDKAAAQPHWEALNYAVGDRDGDTEIHAAEVSEVSSLLTATGAATTGSWTVTTPQPVQVRRLDSLFPSFAPTINRVYLKLDIQGYERYALDGAERVLESVIAIELELSTIPLYMGESLLPDMVYRLSGMGFGVFSIDPVVVDHTTGRVLQVEVLFLRNQRSKSE